MTPIASPDAFAPALLAWYEAHRRALPWRQTTDPYAILVSEVMLQQTQVSRVMDFYARFLARFPTVNLLAQAADDELLKAWEGLGYYRRARFLRECARVVASEHGGRFPATSGELARLPGIGPYTAKAVAAIAFGEQICAVDANVERVLSRLTDDERPLRSAAVKRDYAALADSLVPPGRACAFVQAMMELGALVCRPKNPRCGDCPVTAHCVALARDTVAVRPNVAKRPSVIPIHMASGLLVHQGGIFVQRRLPDDVWGGLWEFPGGVMEAGESPSQTVVREFAEETGLCVRAVSPLAEVRHGYMRYQVTLNAVLVALDPPRREFPEPVLTAASAWRLIEPSQLDDLAFSAGHRKIVDRLFAAGPLSLPLRHALEGR